MIIKLLSEYKNEQLQLLHSPPLKTGKYAFQDSNYLYIQSLFAKIYSLTTSGNYVALSLDLTDFPNINKIISWLTRNNLHLSVLDLSNAYGYIGEAMTGQLLEVFRPIAHDNSLLFLSYGANDHILTPDPRHPDIERLGWEHFAYTFKYFDGYTGGDLEDKLKRTLSPYSSSYGAMKKFWHGTINEIPVRLDPCKALSQETK